jgi:hypothetical protein
MRFWVLVLAACGSSPPPTPMPSSDPPAPAPITPDAGAPADAALAVVEEHHDEPALPGGVTAHFAVDRIVGETTPTLIITVRNRGRAPVPFPAFSDPTCFTFFNLDMTLTPPGGKPTRPRTSCKADAIVDGSKRLAAGAVATEKVSLAALFGELAALGLYELDISWAPIELAKIRGEAGVAQVGSSTNAADRFAIAKRVSTRRLERGKSMKLGTDATFVFTSHGHKHTMAGGPPSPLIVHGTFTYRKARPVDVSINVHVDESKVFGVRGHILEIIDYAYDDYMQLQYWGRIEKLGVAGNY